MNVVKTILALGTLFLILSHFFAAIILVVVSLILWFAFITLTPLGQRWEERNQKEIRRVEAEKKEQERKERREKREREKRRDADSQTTPFSYAIGRHALETLALRYGIAHSYRDPEGRVQDAKTILIRKIRKFESHKEDLYLAELPDYRERTVIAVIEPGTDYVKTFYPRSGKKWFDDNSEWEEALKGNKSFTIKDMARMHFDRMNSRRQNDETA